MIKKQKLFKVQTDVIETRRQIENVLAESEEHAWEKFKQEGLRRPQGEQLINVESETTISPAVE